MADSQQVSARVDEGRRSRTRSAPSPPSHGQYVAIPQRPRHHCSHLSHGRAAGRPAVPARCWAPARPTVVNALAGNYRSPRTGTVLSSEDARRRRYAAHCCRPGRRLDADGAGWFCPTMLGLGRHRTACDGVSARLRAQSFPGERSEWPGKVCEPQAAQPGSHALM